MEDLKKEMEMDEHIIPLAELCSRLKTHEEKVRCSNVLVELLVHLNRIGNGRELRERGSEARRSQLNHSSAIDSRMAAVLSEHVRMVQHLALGWRVPLLFSLCHSNYDTRRG